MLFKLIFIAIVGVIIAVILKEVKPELGILTTVTIGLIMLINLSQDMKNIISEMTALMEKSGLKNGIYTSVIKIIGIGYITEFASGLCDDYGNSSISKKVQLAGKISIFVLAIPIFSNLISILSKFIGS